MQFILAEKDLKTRIENSLIDELPHQCRKEGAWNFPIEQRQNSHNWEKTTSILLVCTMNRV